MVEPVWKMAPSVRSIEVVPEEVLVSLAREHLDGLDGVYVAPEIPGRKLRNVLAAHGRHLVGEAVVVLMDATMWGSGENGFVATPERLCWKNLMEHPRSVRWAELSRTAVHAMPHHVDIARGRVPVPWVDGGAERVRAFLVACGRRTLLPAAPYRGLVGGQEARTLAESIVERARRALGEVEWVHYRPSIPVKMEASARLVHEKHLGADEEVLVLYDDTVFGSGNDGLLLTERAVCWRHFWGTAERLAWTKVRADRIAVDGDLLALDGHPENDSRWRIDLRMRPGMARVVAGLLEEIACAVNGELAAPRWR